MSHEGERIWFVKEWRCEGGQTRSSQLLATMTTATPQSLTEVGTSSQGDTIEEALGNLREATELYLEERPPSQR